MTQILEVANIWPQTMGRSCQISEFNLCELDLQLALIFAINVALFCARANCIEIFDLVIDIYQMYDFECK